MTEVIKLVDKDLETGIINALNIISYWGFSGGKKSIYNARELGSIPGLGRSPGEGNGNSLQYSCLENSMDRGDWWATVHGVTELDTTEQVTLCISGININCS